MTSPNAGTSPEWLRRDWLWGAILVLAVIAIYTPVWWAGYIWDDNVNVTANPSITSPSGLKEIWTTSAAQFYPLTLTTFWIEHRLWGAQPLPYHLVNVFLHAACAVVLWRVLLSLRIPGAWLGAALWALHPVQVETVAWVSELKNTQSGLFYLLTILFFVRWLRGNDLKSRIGWDWNYALSFLFAVMAITSKSSTVVLPVVLCLCAWWVEGRWQWRNLLSVAPIIPLSLAASLLTLWTQVTLSQGLFESDPPWVGTWQGHLAAAGEAFWFYLSKVIWPYPLISLYPRLEIEISDPLYYLPLLAVVAVLAILWWKRDSWFRPWFSAFTYFLVVMLPMLEFAGRYIADHFLYLASIGPLTLAGAGLAWLADRVIPGRLLLQAAAACVFLLICGTWSWQRAWVYENEETFWADTLAKYPNCVPAHINLGAIASRRGQLDEAIAHLNKALAIDPNSSDANDNLGDALSRKGQLDEAMLLYRKALGINPANVEAYNNLGNALLAKGETDEAIAQFRKALEIKPRDGDSHYNLGAALLRSGKVDEAIAQFGMALEINPDDAQSHNNLGAILFHQGHVDAAIAEFQKALQLQPGYLKAQSNLANAMAAAQRAGQK